MIVVFYHRRPVLNCLRIFSHAGLNGSPTSCLVNIYMNYIVSGTFSELFVEWIKDISENSLVSKYALFL